jgi:hypothetical protein
MNDNDMLATVRSSLTGVKDSLTDVRMDRPPEAITARARARLLRRGLSGAAVAGTALGLSLALAAGPAAPRSVHVNLAAWSVNTTPAGLVDITIRELKDPALLRQTLAGAGVTAVVNLGRLCTPESTVRGGEHVLVEANGGRGGPVELRVNPAEMPAGSELVISIFGPSKATGGELRSGWALAKDGSPLDCGPQVTSGTR